MIRKKELQEDTNSLRKLVTNLIKENHSIREDYEVRLWKLENTPEYKIGDCIKHLIDLDCDGIVRDIECSENTLFTLMNTPRKQWQYSFNTPNGIMKVTAQQINDHE
jgi:hypothetical protein